MNEAKELDTAVDIALLAPVPAEHLKSALELLKTQEKVAFGSMDFLLFDQLRTESCSLPVDVYIYASGREACPDAAPFWRATYIGFTPCSETKLGSHPNGMEYRPESTKKYALDNEGHWLVFWEIKDLKSVPPENWPIGKMTGYRTNRRYSKFFVPKGPYLINHPPAS